MNIANINNIIQPVAPNTPNVPNTTVDGTQSPYRPTFLDVFTQVAQDAVETQQISSQDKIRLVIGDADDLEQIQLNKEKAGLALELLVNVRNSVLDAYNEIIKMQI